MPEIEDIEELISQCLPGWSEGSSEAIREHYLKNCWCKKPKQEQEENCPQGREETVKSDGERRPASGAVCKCGHEKDLHTGFGICRMEDCLCLDFEEKEGTEAKDKKIHGVYYPAPSETSVLTSEEKTRIQGATYAQGKGQAERVMEAIDLTEARVLEKERKRTELSIECWRDAYDQQKEDYHLLLEKKNAEIDALKGANKRGQDLLLRTIEDASKVVKEKDNRIRELEQERNKIAIFLDKIKRIAQDGETEYSSVWDNQDEETQKDFKSWVSEVKQQDWEYPDGWNRAWRNYRIEYLGFLIEQENAELKEVKK